MKLFLILTLCVYSVYANSYVSSHLEPFTDELMYAINALNTTWKAGKNFKDPSTVDIDKLVSTHETVPNLPDFFRKYVFTGHYEKAGKFDARVAWPKCTSIGKIYDQRKGYPSWIYTAVGTIADRLCIKHGIQIDVANTVDKMIRFSGISTEYNSANMIQALDYWSKNGIFISEEDSNCLPHSLKCQNGIKLHRFFNVSNEYYRDTIDAVRDLKLIGPISAYMLVGADFPMYKSGVYVRSIEKNLGIQNVKLIGSGKENDTLHFVAAGSWGTEWGDKGFFKILSSAKDFAVYPYLIRTTLEPVRKNVPKSFDYGQLFYLAK